MTYPTEFSLRLPSPSPPAALLAAQRRGATRWRYPLLSPATPPLSRYPLPLLKDALQGSDFRLEGTALVTRSVSRLWTQIFLLNRLPNVREKNAYLGETLEKCFFEDAWELRSTHCKFESSPTYYVLTKSIWKRDGIENHGILNAKNTLGLMGSRPKVARNFGLGLFFKLIFRMVPNKLAQYNFRALWTRYWTTLFGVQRKLVTTW